MASKLERLENNKAKLEIEVGAGEFKEGIQKAYLKVRGKYNVPGFRKGKAPQFMIENFYGEGVFFEEAFDEVFPKAYEDAVAEHKLDVVSRPDIDVLKVSKEEGVTFTAEVFLKPEVKLGEYKGIEVTRKEDKVGAKEVNAELEKVRNQNVRWVEMEREAKTGDTVVLDYSGSVDGVKFDGGTAEGQTLELGSGRFIPGFEEQVVGLKPGEKKDITVTFPAEYPAAELAGKEAVFALNIISVKEKELPELDDDFAKDVSEFDTLADYKKDIKKNLKKAAEDKAKSQMEDDLLKAIVENSQVEVPEPMIETQTNSQIQQLAYQLMYQGMKLEDYLKYIGKTIEDLKADYHESSEKQVRMRLCLEAMIEAEGIEATEEDVEKQVAKLAEDAKKTPEEYKKLIREEDMEYFRDRIKIDKLFDFLVANAKITQEEEKNAEDSKEEQKKDENN